jgi:hypothetical protein
VAFVLQHSWRAASFPGEAGLRGAAARPGRFAARWDRPLRTAAGTLLTVIVHLLLLWLFLTRLSGDVGDAGRAAVESVRLSAFKLAGPLDRAAPTDRPLSRAATSASEVETTAATEMPPREWTVARIVMPVTAIPAPAARPPAAGNGNAGGTGSGVYDPFAGAAPLRTGTARRGQWVLDVAALEGVRRSVSAGVRRPGGSVELTVSVSPAGTIVEAVVTGGTAPDEDKEKLRRALLGKPLYKGASEAQTLRLPLILLG